MVELLFQKISRFVHGSKLKHYRDDQRTVTNCGARDESIVRESKNLLHNGEHPPARRDRIGNNYPSHVSPSECEAITQCLITISARARSREYETPSVVSRISIIGISICPRRINGDDPIFTLWKHS